MKIHYAVLLAALAATSAQAQLNTSRNGQVDLQRGTQVNTGVSGALPGTTAGSTGPNTPRAPMGSTQTGIGGRTGAAIGTPGVTTPLGSIDDRTPAIGTTSITNTTSGSSLTPGVNGSSLPLNNGSWGTGPNNTLTPAAGSVSGTPGSSAAGSATGIPTGR